VPVGDTDCDGFIDPREGYIGTDATDRCADTVTADDEADDKWIPDFNDDRSVNVLDFARWKVFFPDASPLVSAAAKRSDLNADDSVNALDFAVWKAYFTSTCTP
jgi:hypothetical protein